MRESETETGGIIGSSRSLAPLARHQDLKIEEPSAVNSWSWGLEKPEDRPSQTGGPWQRWPPQGTSADNGQEPKQIGSQSQGPHSRTREPGIIRDWRSFIRELLLLLGSETGCSAGKRWRKIEVELRDQSESPLIILKEGFSTILKDDVWTRWWLSNLFCFFSMNFPLGFLSPAPILY